MRLYIDALCMVRIRICGTCRHGFRCTQWCRLLRRRQGDCVARRYPDFRWFPQVTLASVDIFHAVTATEEHVRPGRHYLVPLVAVVGRTADTKSAVDDFVKWKRIESLACVINSCNKFLRKEWFSQILCLPLLFTFARCQIFFIWVLSSTKVSEFWHMQALDNLLLSNGLLSCKNNKSANLRKLQTDSLAYEYILPYTFYFIVDVHSGYEYFCTEACISGNSRFSNNRGTCGTTFSSFAFCRKKTGQ